MPSRLLGLPSCKLGSLGSKRPEICLKLFDTGELRREDLHLLRVGVGESLHSCQRRRGLIGDDRNSHLQLCDFVKHLLVRHVGLPI